MVEESKSDMKTSKEIVKLISQDGDAFEIDIDTVTMSGLVKDMLNGN